MRTLSPWVRVSHNPFRSFRELERQMDELFGSLSSAQTTDDLRTRTLATSCDTDETESHYLVSVDLPGVTKDNIKVEINNQVLTISGERKRFAKSSEDKESSHAQYSRSFTLPQDVDTEAIEANFENGVLEVALPKKEAARPRQITIGEKGGFLSKLIGAKDSSKNHQ
jgi:HSP20 family protein